MYESSLLLRRNFGWRVLSNATLRNLRPVEPIVNEIVSLSNIRGLEVDSYDIDEFVEEHNQDRSTEELMELHCVSQQEVMEESLTEEVTAKQKPSSAIREMLKA
ncbi:hypothetical protein AVEN_34251-1 [Araneus ventricosus]|uniref:Uncharacterized protein n=1 Tax=Araneus ventricosus TaxID=182803 RepID=A0A4Y2M0D2_ARAVE|nr:hypothetical protein AVEN_239187-1 [Araneus ventricosus]GBN19185.1 hypothetical protein AVEN_34251-1 [Araneus ventricosus]